MPIRMLSSDVNYVKFGLFDDPRTIAGGYAILSHVWKNVEQSYEETSLLAACGAATVDNTPGLSAKVQHCYHLARGRHIPWFWIDAPCIDQKNSVELSEAITSMYDWYAHSSVCFAHLPDVPPNGTPWEPGSAFRCSVYFKRGWTLQELIAPRQVIFLAADWSVIGTKQKLAPLLEEITGIDSRVLTFDCGLEEVSVARRLSWASHRRTSRVEDKAYSLFGLFGIRIPLFYGEGDGAFVRLQQAILAKICDHTLFAWSSPADMSSTGTSERDPCAPLASTPFAGSPAAFASASRMVAVDTTRFLAAMMPFCDTRYDDHKLLPCMGPVDHHGLKCRLPVLFDGPDPFAALLQCQEPNSKSSYIALALGSVASEGPGVYRVGAPLRSKDIGTSRPTPRLLEVHLDSIPRPIRSRSGIVKKNAFHIRFLSFHLTADSNIPSLIPAAVAIPTLAST